MFITLYYALNLALKFIRNHSTIKGVKVKNKNAEYILKIIHYADETTTFLQNRKEYIRNIIDLIDFRSEDGHVKIKIACISKTRDVVQGQIKHK